MTTPTHVHLSWRLLVPAAGLAAVLTAPGALAGTTTSYTYVAGHPVFFTGDEQAQRDTPAGKVALRGEVAFVPDRGSFTLTVNDAAAAAGSSIPIIVHQFTGKKSPPVLHTCIRVGSPRRFDGYQPGTSVSVHVKSASWGWVLSECGASGTTGTITVAT